ncbi:MAG: phosphoglycerate dehydrogenase [Propionibacteriaceae bacterium]|jgi:D-3-phosphoglycerate dehydrogenase|nr:phosphoglycerate dehydrogenase [Propionibacteriaceae bacterium]
MNKSVIIGPVGYERLFPESVKQLEESGYDVILNPGNGPITVEHLNQYGSQCHAIIAGLEPWDEQRMALVPKCRIIAKCGAGLDSIDVKTARKRGIRVTSAVGKNANAVAELTVALMLDLIRGVSHSTRLLRHGRRVLHSGYELSGMTVGIIGWGNIGRLVARRLSGFDVRFVVFDPAITGPVPGVTLALSIEALVKASDVVTLHTPLTEHTAHMINSELLEHFKPNAYLINTARGGLIDEDALANALDNKKLAGAGLDVLVDEITPGSSRLIGRPDVVISPHLGAETWDAYRAVGDQNVEDILTTLGSPRMHKESK